MSGTQPAPTVASVWGAPAVSVYSLTIFLAAMVIAYIAKNDTALTLLFGAAATNATTVIGFWVGSSSGSQRKDEVIAAAVPVPPPPLATADLTAALNRTADATEKNTSATVADTNKPKPPL